MTNAQERTISKLVRHSDIAELQKYCAERGDVVATGGCFDILHAGHVRMFHQAADLGDWLVVCVNSDESVRRLKGPGRPIVPLQDRLEVLNALEVVDYLVVFDSDTPEELLAVLCPNIWVKAADYQHKALPEQAVVEEHGGTVQILPYHPGHSTTALWAGLQGAEVKQPDPVFTGSPTEFALRTLFLGILEQGDWVREQTHTSIPHPIGYARSGYYFRSSDDGVYLTAELEHEYAPSSWIAFTKIAEIKRGERTIWSKGEDDA